MAISAVIVGIVGIVGVIGAAIGVGVGVAWGRRDRGGAEEVVDDDGRTRVDADAVRDPSSALLRHGVEHLDVGVVIVDDGGEVVFRNAAAREFQGTHIGVLVDEHVDTTLAEAHGVGSVRRLAEVHGPPKLWLEIVAAPLPEGGAVAMIRDVSERVRVDAMRTDFVTNVSHELKTPVGAIAVLAETLVDEHDPAVAARFAARLVGESHRAARTIDDLLELSQIESTRPDDGVVDLIAVTRRAIERGRSADRGRAVDLVAHESTATLLIRGDETQLASAVGNLVENAVKYSHDGGLVEVRTHRDATAIEIVVTDQGVGIPARDLDRVFERFYRIDRARSRETGGTGLGLSIVRHVALNHGGDVLVTSQEGEGSTFVLRLPASLVVDPATTEEETTP